MRVIPDLQVLCYRCWGHLLRLRCPPLMRAPECECSAAMKPHSWARTVINRVAVSAFIICKTAPARIFHSYGRHRRPLLVGLAGSSSSSSMAAARAEQDGGSKPERLRGRLISCAARTMRPGLPRAGACLLFRLQQRTTARSRRPSTYLRHGWCISVRHEGKDAPCVHARGQGPTGAEAIVQTTDLVLSFLQMEMEPVEKHSIWLENRFLHPWRKSPTRGVLITTSRAKLYTDAEHFTTFTKFQLTFTGAARSISQCFQMQPPKIVWNKLQYLSI